MEAVDKMDPDDLIKFLKEKRLQQEAIKIVEDEKIDGEMFLKLKEADLKDLFSSFMLRKQIRDIQEEVKKDETEEQIEMLSPPKTIKLEQMEHSFTPSSRTNSPVSSISSLSSTENIDIHVIVPYSAVLQDPSTYSEAEISRERVSIIRNCMDSLISFCKGGRPTDGEIMQTARLIATRYPCLRDKPDDPTIRNNYVIGFIICLCMIITI